MPGPRVHTYFGEEDRLRAYKYSLELALKILGGEVLELANPPDAPLPKTINPGRAAGIGIGGNIIIHVFLMAAGRAPSHRGGILFLENIEEHAWRVDDYMSVLELSGALRETSGIILGEFPEPKSYPHPSPSIEEVLATRIRGATKNPAFMNYSCCHARYILPYPIGIELEIDADNGVLAMKEPLTE
jgi:muramoyltetrapeptide carboxypeptidase